MNNFNAGLSEIGEVADPERITFANKDHEGGFVYDPLFLGSPPIVRDMARLNKSLDVAFDREDSDVSRSSLQDLVGDGFGAGE